MKAHWQYFKYVMRHKWHVAEGCFALGVPIWQTITHDLSKFSRAEWFAYVDWFYGHKPSDAEIRIAASLGIFPKTREEMKYAFDVAWNHHQKANPHHWRYWILVTDSDDPRLRALPIPQRYVLEMVADWYGAGMAINGHNDIEGWYLKNKDNIILEDGTRLRVERAIARIKWL